MTIRINGAAPRALIGAVRADATDTKALFEQVNKAVAEMRSKLDGVSAKVDPLDLAQIDAINASVGDMQKALDEQNNQIAALKLGGTPGDGLTAKDREHVAAFNDFTRQGKVEARGATFSDPDGGFLTPKQVDLTVTRILGETVAMRRLATVMSISGDTYVKHKSVGGAASGWVGEGDTRSETDTPTLKRMEFATGEIYAEPATNQKLLDDAQFDVEAWYSGEVAQTFAEEEGTAFISGDGIKKPRGLTTYSNVANASYAWGSIGYIATGEAAAFKTPSSSVSPGDCLIDLQHALKAGYRGSARFLMNDLTFATVRKFKDAEGNFLWRPGLSEAAPSLLLGKPVETDDNMPDVGAGTYPIAFGDFQQAYMIVDRLGVRVLRNPYKTNGVVYFYTTKRVGGGVQNFEAVKLLKVASS